MLIPFETLPPDTLRAVLESYALREGTDYGEQEVDLEAKVDQLSRQLKAQQAFIVFDAKTESCSLVSKDEWQRINSFTADGVDS